MADATDGNNPNLDFYDMIRDQEQHTLQNPINAETKLERNNKNKLNKIKT